MARPDLTCALQARLEGDWDRRILHSLSSAFKLAADRTYSDKVSM